MTSIARALALASALAMTGMVHAVDSSGQPNDAADVGGHLRSRRFNGLRAVVDGFDAHGDVGDGVRHLSRHRIRMPSKAEAFEDRLIAVIRPLAGRLDRFRLWTRP